MNVSDWALTALPGEKVTYLKAAPYATPLGPARATALAAHEAGLVFLSRRRVGDLWLYEATRISPRTRDWIDRVSFSVEAPIKGARVL